MKKTPTTTASNKKDPMGIPNVNFSCFDKSTNKERTKKYKKQRIERGFDDSELWNLDSTIAQFITPRLKAFKEYTQSYPGGMESFEKWKEILDQMVEGFELWQNHWEWENESDQNIINEKRHKVDVALELFHKHFFDLWD
jgi:hypothetical protein